jgi:hypothetical protein
MRTRNHWLVPFTKRSWDSKDVLAVTASETTHGGMAARI